MKHGSFINTVLSVYGLYLLQMELGSKLRKYLNE